MISTDKIKKTYATALLCAVVMLVSCNIDSPQCKGCEEDTEVEVSLNVVMDIAQTRASVEAESTINSLHLLVFDASNADGVEANATYKYYRHTLLEESGKYRTTLDVANNLNIYLVANAGTLLSTIEQISAGETFADVYDELIMTNPNNIVKNKIPMWGTIINKNIEVSSSRIHLGDIALLRSVASADIEVQDQNFVFEKAYIANGVSKGYMAHRTSLIQTSGQISAPQTPADALYNLGNDQSWMATPTTNSNGHQSVENKFYMFENDATAPSSTESKKMTRLIMQGKFGDGQSTYYPILFRNADNEKIQVARNRKFEITITKVNGPGFTTFAGALTAEDADLQYSVIAWDKYNRDLNFMSRGDKYVSLSSKMILVPNAANSQTHFHLSTNALEYSDNKPQNLKMSFSGYENLQPVDEVSNDRFKVKLTADATSNSGEEFCLDVTALREYSDQAGGNIEATLSLQIGEIQFEMILRQLDNHWIDGGDFNTEI